jgi:hypothetical protein
VLLAPSVFSGRIISSWVFVSLFVFSFSYLLKGEAEETYGLMTSSAVLQIALLLLARSIARKTFRAIVATQSLAGVSVVTIGELSELHRLSTSSYFVIRFE